MRMDVRRISAEAVSHPGRRTAPLMSAKGNGQIWRKWKDEGLERLFGSVSLGEYLITFCRTVAHDQLQIQAEGKNLQSGFLLFVFFWGGGVTDETDASFHSVHKCWSRRSETSQTPMMLQASVKEAAKRFSLNRAAQNGTSLGSNLSPRPCSETAAHLRCSEEAAGLLVQSSMEAS